MKRTAFLAVTGAAVLAPRFGAGAAEGLHPLRVGTMAADFGAQAYFAKDLGLYTKAGFAEADVTSLANGAAIAAAALSSALDVGYSNVLSIAIAHDKGIPLVILAGANVYDSKSPTVGLIGVGRSAPIKTAADLSGKTLATTGINNIPHIGARNWIDTNGGDSTKVKFVEMPASSMGPAIAAGRIDGGIMNQGDYPSLGKPEDPVRILADAFNSIGPRFISGAYFATSDWVAKNPADAKAFITAMNGAGAWANAHAKESAAILARYLKESPAAIEAAPRVVFATSVTPALLQPSIDVGAKYGILKTAFPAKDFISPLAL
jgi:NitT/TauT family transport system substrate-binding protein